MLECFLHTSNMLLSLYGVAELRTRLRVRGEELIYFSFFFNFFEPLGEEKLKKRKTEK